MFSENFLRVCLLFFEILFFFVNLFIIVLIMMFGCLNCFLRVFNVVVYMIFFDFRLEMDFLVLFFRCIWSWIICMLLVRCILLCMCILKWFMKFVYDRVLLLNKGSCIEGMFFLVFNLKSVFVMVMVFGLELERFVFWNFIRLLI